MLRTVFLTIAVTFVPKAIASDNPPDWSNYTNHSKIEGVIVKGELDKITLQVPKLEKGKNNGNYRRRRPNVHLGHENIVIPYAPSGIVRWEKLQPGADGKLPTGKALDALRLPYGAPGYAAEKTELRPGLVVEVHLVRPREVTAAKATEKDLSIKYVIIIGETKAPPSKDDKKKKN